VVSLNTMLFRCLQIHQKTKMTATHMSLCTTLGQMSEVH
jgi:hypothetical protein